VIDGDRYPDGHRVAILACSKPNPWGDLPTGASCASMAHMPALTRRRSADQCCAKGWLWRHESGVYVKFTEAGAGLFA